MYCAISKKIAVISERPRNAKEHTVLALGIDDHVDCLVTTNKISEAKTSCLFPKVRASEHQGKEYRMVEDNDERDMRPALDRDIF
jgi:FMN phosphatase YigB (HAD superfamily)